MQLVNRHEHRNTSNPAGTGGTLARGALAGRELPKDLVQQVGYQVNRVRATLFGTQRSRAPCIFEDSIFLHFNTF